MGVKKTISSFRLTGSLIPIIILCVLNILQFESKTDSKSSRLTIKDTSVSKGQLNKEK